MVAMKFSECATPVYSSPDYDAMYAALVRANKRGKSLRIEHAGYHHGGVLAQLRKRHTDKKTRVASQRDGDAAVIVFIDKE